MALDASALGIGFPLAQSTITSGIKQKQTLWPLSETEMELPDNHIHLYFSYPEKISDPELLKRYASLLTDEEHAQMARFVYPRHRHQFLVTRALVRTCLSAYFQVEPGDWRFGKNGFGKPEIGFPENAGSVRFNISHCDGLIICGITRHHDIGVDVEDAKRFTRTSFESLSNYFSATETADMARLPVDQQQLRFFDYWTLKESYIKARGMGLAIPLAKFSFRFEADRLNAFETHPDLDDDAAAWQFWRISRDDRYRIAVAINAANPGFELSALDTVPLKSCDSIQLDFL